MKQFGMNVKQQRLKRNLTLKALSSLTGVSQAMLSEIERNTKMPTIEIACKIADGLEVNLMELLEKQEESKVRVIRSNERPVLASGDTFRRYLLSPSLPFSHIEFEYCIIPHGHTTGPITPHRPPLKEYLVVTAGKITLRIGRNEKQIELCEGDSVAYQLPTEHELINSGAGDACFYYISETRAKL